MPGLDSLLYEWIGQANQRRDDLDFPIGLLEDSTALLVRTLGSGYLEQLLIADPEPVHFVDDEACPLRKWLLSARVETHIVQLMELAAYLRTFQDDPALPDKIEKLKRDRFWPVFFELAMATRVRRGSRVPQEVNLNPEVPSSIGDFTIRTPGYSIPCECSRLGYSPQITEPRALEESLSHRIGDGTKRLTVALCVKIRSEEALTGDTYNRILRLIRRGLADARRSQLPVDYHDGSTVVAFEEIVETSEQIPFKLVDGKVQNVLGTDWDSATRLCRVPAKDSSELADRFDQGERFGKYESVRLFMKFGPPVGVPDQYKRLTEKLKKKLKQIKTSEEHRGKIVFVEVPFDLRAVDSVKLGTAVHDAAVHSSTTLAVILAHREPNPQTRHHYSIHTTFNRSGANMLPEMVELFDRVAKGEIAIDPILGSPYRRSWAEAQVHAEQIARPRTE